MGEGSATQRLAVIASMAVGAVTGVAAGVVLGFWSGDYLGPCCFAGFGFSGGLTAGCVAATLFVWLLRPRDPGGPEADYDDAPPPD